MASGHVIRANRPNTWLHRPALHVKKTLASREPSTHGTTRNCRDNGLKSAKHGKADIYQRALVALRDCVSTAIASR